MLYNNFIVMNNITDKLILIITVLSTALILTSSVIAEDGPFIAKPGTPADNAAPAVNSDIKPEYTDETIKTIVLEPDASCINVSCHAGMVKKKYLHAIGVDGMKCSRCHEKRIEGRHDFKKIPDETMFLCAQCHRADVLPPKDLKKSPPKVLSTDAAKHLHKPFEEGKCTLCHDAHSSNYYKHLKFSFPEGIYAPYQIDTYALCASCHKDLVGKLTEPRTLNLTMFRNGNVNLHYRHVNKNKGRTCVACHHPHGLVNTKLLRDTFRFGNRMLTVDYEKSETGGQCATTCHRVAKYDRYKPEFNFIKTDPLPGEKATEEELEQSRQDDLKRLKEKEKPINAEETINEKP